MWKTLEGSEINLDHIAVTKILKRFTTNGCKYLEDAADIKKITKIIRGPSWRNQSYKKNHQVKKRSFVEESVVFIFPYETNRNLAMKLSRVSKISEQQWNWTFDFTETVNNNELNKGTLCYLKFISHFSVKLHMQFWKYFPNIVFGNVGKDYCKKIWC